MLTDDVTKDPFSATEMTDAINKMPFVDDGLKDIIPATSSECMTERVQVDTEQGFVQVLPISGRGAEPTANQRNKRSTVDLKLPVYEVTDTILERENLQAVRETGSLALRSAETRRNIILEPMGQSMAFTRAWQRVKGWLDGRIYDNNGDLWQDIYARLGEQQIVKEWDVSNVKFDLSETITDQKEEIEDELGGYNAQRYVVVCGRNANRRLRRLAQMKEASTNAGRFFVQQRDNRKGVPIQEDVDVIGYGRHVMRLPNGTIVPFIDEDYAYMVPIGPGLAREIAGPSDMKQFRGQILDQYVSIRDLGHGKGEEVLVQGCFLHYQSRPRAVVKIKVSGPLV